MTIIDKPANPKNYSVIGRMPIQIVVVHVESGSEAGTINWFANENAHVSAHYSVSKAGQAYSHVPENCVAYHAGIPAPCIWNDNSKNQWHSINPNRYSIGIENEGMDDGQPWPDAQVATLVELITDVCKRYGVTADRAHIVGHHEIYAGHTCPGSACPLDAIVSAVAANMQQNG